MTDESPARTVTDASGTRIVLQGEIDTLVINQVQACVDTALNEDRASLVIDLTEVTFMDSSGLGVLAQASSQAAAVTLISPSPMLRRLLTTVGLGDSFLITDEKPSGDRPPSP